MRKLTNPASGVVRGCLLMVISTVGFSAMHATVRQASLEVHPVEIAFFRNLFGLVALAPWLLWRGGGPLRTGRFPLHLGRALLNVVAMLMFFTALTMTPLAQVQALGFTAPLFATALAALLLGEQVRARRWTAVVAGFVGALIILRPGVVALDTGSVLTLGSAAIWGVCLILIKRLSRTESALTITTYMVLLMTPLSLLPALLVWTWPSPEAFGWLVACGVLGTLAQLLMTQAIKLADASVVLPLDFMKIVWSACIGWLVFGELVDGWTWLGAVIIFAGATYVALRERALARSS